MLMGAGVGGGRGWRAGETQGFWGAGEGASAATAQGPREERFLAGEKSEGMGHFPRFYIGQFTI